MAKILGLITLKIELPADRDYLGALWALDGLGNELAGPYRIAARASDDIAAEHGNPTRATTLPYGDPPLGSYKVHRMAKTGEGTRYRQDLFGVLDVVILNGVGGHAALADANGRFEIVIHGGPLSANGGLRASTGHFRISDPDLAALADVIGRAEAATCVCEQALTNGAVAVVADLHMTTDRRAERRPPPRRQPRPPRSQEYLVAFGEYTSPEQPLPDGQPGQPDNPGILPLNSPYMPPAGQQGAACMGMETICQTMQYSAAAAQAPDVDSYAGGQNPNAIYAPNATPYGGGPSPFFPGGQPVNSYNGGQAQTGASALPRTGAPTAVGRVGSPTGTSPTGAATGSRNGAGGIPGAGGAGATQAATGTGWVRGNAGAPWTGGTAGTGGAPWSGGPPATGGGGAGGAPAGNQAYSAGQQSGARGSVSPIEASAVLPFYFPPQKGDVFTLMPYHDTGSTFLNYAVNWYYGYANLSAALLNLPGEMIAAAEDGARAIGFNESEILAAEMYNPLAAGVSEMQILPGALATLAQGFSELAADERGSMNLGALLGSSEGAAPSRMISGSGPDTVYVGKYITDELQPMLDLGRGGLDNNPAQFFGYDYTQSPQFQLRFEAGHLLEGFVGDQLALNQSFVSNLVEPIAYGEQAGGGGLLGDFRLQQPFQDMWGLKQWDVTTPGSAWSKMQAGKDRLWLLYPSYFKPNP